MSSNCNVFFVNQDLDYHIKNVKRQYHCSIEEISNMYLDAVDYHGLIYWSNDAVEYQDQTLKALNKK